VPRLFSRYPSPFWASPDPALARVRVLVCGCSPRLAERRAKALRIPLAAPVALVPAPGRPTLRGFAVKPVPQAVRVGNARAAVRALAARRSF